MITKKSIIDGLKLYMLDLDEDRYAIMQQRALVRIMIEIVRACLNDQMAAELGSDEGIQAAVAEVAGLDLEEM